MEHVWSATSKAGKIYIGDPCYVMKDAVYHGVWGDQHNFDNGEFEHDDLKFAIGGTAYGDGNYSGSTGTFPVDAGVIGAVPSELLDEEKVAEYNERTFPGIMVDADEVILEYDDEGRFDFKTTKGVSIAFIDTVYDNDYDDDDYDDDVFGLLGRFKKYDDDDDGKFPEVTEFINTVIPSKAAHSIAKELGIKNRDGVYQYGTKYNGFEMVENRETGEDYMFIGTKTALVDRILKQIDELDDETEDLDESVSVREGVSNVPGLKIAYVTVSPTKIYDTYKGAIVVNASINGLPSEFVFRAARSDNIWFTGIDCNSATINGERVYISNGGGQTHYALQIYTDVLKAAPKTGQKNFQWTGREYSTTPIIQAFKKALQDLFKKGDLTPQFLKAIGHKDEEALTEAVSRFTSSFRAGLREARAPKMKWYLMERDNPQLGTYWVKKGPFTKADAPGKSKSVYGGSTYHVFDTEEEYDAKIAELKAAGQRVNNG